MTVRRILPKQKGRKCDWCGDLATQRGFMWRKCACGRHLAELQAWDRREQAPDYSDAAFVGGY